MNAFEAAIRIAVSNEIRRVVEDEVETATRRIVGRVAHIADNITASILKHSHVEQTSDELTTIIVNRLVIR